MRAALRNIPAPTLDEYHNRPPSTSRTTGGKRVRGVCPKNVDRRPLVSIVTPVRNGERHLRTTIQSVRNQSYQNIEYIVIDGNSTDGTLDILRENEDVIDFWIQEPDTGIYDAMNKGIAFSRGDLIKIINADDWLEPLATEFAVVESSTKGEGIVIGKMGLANEGGQLLDLFRPNLSNRLYPAFQHPTWFVSRGVYQKLGLYHTHLKLAADYEFFRRAIARSVPIHILDEHLVNFRVGGTSSGIEAVYECYTIDCSYLGNRLAALKFPHYLLQKIRHLVAKKILGTQRGYSLKYFLKAKFCKQNQPKCR